MEEEVNGGAEGMLAGKAEVPKAFLDTEDMAEFCTIRSSD